MKLKELIECLKAIESYGEVDVVIDGCAVTHATLLPGHYDGPYEVLDNDENGNIVKACIRSDGNKVVIGATSIKDIILDRPEFAVDLSHLSEQNQERYKSRLDEEREEARRITRELEVEAFEDWLKSKGYCGDDSAESIYYDLNLHKVPLPEAEWVQGKNAEYLPSINERRNALWDKVITIEISEGTPSVSRRDLQKDKDRGDAPFGR